MSASRWNSAGVLTVPAARGDWVRPGLLLYGASPLAGSFGTDLGLQPVMTLQSRIIALRSVAVGERIGYGGVWTAARPTRLAIAGVGYGDGYPRSLPSGTPVLVDGEVAPLAGRVSMDMLAIDVTDLDPVPSLGTAVVLWGPCLSSGLQHSPARSRTSGSAASASGWRSIADRIGLCRPGIPQRRN